MCYDVSSLEAHHLVIAHQCGMAIVPLAKLEDALKLRVVIWVPTACGPMLLMEVIKGLHFRQQTPSLLHTFVHPLINPTIPLFNHSVSHSLKSLGSVSLMEVIKGIHFRLSQPLIHPTIHSVSQSVIHSWQGLGSVLLTEVIKGLHFRQQAPLLLHAFPHCYIQPLIQSASRPFISGSKLLTKVIKGHHSRRRQPPSLLYSRQRIKMTLDG